MDINMDISSLFSLYIVPFYYRTHGKRLIIKTLKDNAVSF